MRCETCDVLRRQLAEARAEAAEWKRASASEIEWGAMAERVDRWSRTLGGTAGEARLLIALTDAAPRVLSIEQLGWAVRPGRDPDDLMSAKNVVRTFVFRVRRGLKPLVKGFPIRAVYQLGYAMSAADAAEVRRAMGDEA